MLLAAGEGAQRTFSGRPPGFWGRDEIGSQGGSAATESPELLLSPPLLHPLASPHNFTSLPLPHLSQVSGIHWLRAHPSHVPSYSTSLPPSHRAGQAAEATAGYVGDYLHDICQMLAKTNTVRRNEVGGSSVTTVSGLGLHLLRDAGRQSVLVCDVRTCSVPPAPHSTPRSRPEDLVRNAAQAAAEANIGFAGENALFCWQVCSASSPCCS